jgi:ABC-type multidrug transport system fused ATPase/permease subunit
MSVERLSEIINLESPVSNDLTEATKPLASKEFSVMGEQANLTKLNESIILLTPDNEAALLESGWPVGHVQFNNVSMRYNPESPLVLNRVCVDIPAGTTLGVVGRTGSGKSSLLLTLFRLVDVEGAGSITIDGVDIRSLSLQGLRDSLSIIPQSPTLFAGTLLYNLDASGRVTPEAAWSALEAASTELARQFRDSESGLDTMISEGGRNLSLGQRQLICLARALVKRSNILVLDEATSSVDTKTDTQVQETIFREFVQKGVTVITVAHRLDTVLGYDKILVLDAGTMVEFGTPSELLSRNGYLRNLYDADQQNQQIGNEQKLENASFI